MPALIEMNMNGITSVLWVMTSPSVVLSMRTAEKKMYTPSPSEITGMSMGLMKNSSTAFRPPNRHRLSA